MKQTAVEWLYEKLEGMIPRRCLYDMDKDYYFNKAKEMEKQQIINVVEYYCEDTSEAELYYKETFKSE